MIVEATACGHPLADTVDELYCSVCGVLVVEGASSGAERSMADSSASNRRGTSANTSE